jgi:hypothetical protein
VKLLTKFAPPSEEPSSVRRTGARNAFLGLVLMVFGVMIVLSLDRLTKGTLLDPSVPKPSKLRAISGVPVVIGFCALVVGLYRAITGIHPARDGVTTAARFGRLVLMTLIAAALIGAIVIAVASRRAPGLEP